MIELERNKPVDTEDLSEFFSRCGWDEPAGATKLEWALAASHEWVVCRLEGELIGFARSCRLGAFDRVVFDAVVDPRFTCTTLRSQMVAVLAVTAGRLERVLVFGRRLEQAPALPLGTEAFGPFYAPPVTPDMYTGKPRDAMPEADPPRPSPGDASRS
jgi:hypothetical protein